MDVASMNFQTFFQLRLELLKAVDDISRLTGHNLDEKVLTDHHLVNLMRQTVSTARITVHYLTVLVDNNTLLNPEVKPGSANIPTVTIDSSSNLTSGQKEHVTYLSASTTSQASSSAVMRPNELLGPRAGASPRSPKHWRKRSKTSAFSKLDEEGRSEPLLGVNGAPAYNGAAAIGNCEEDENSNSSQGRKRELSGDPSFEDDGEVITNFLEPCQPCSSDSRGETSFLESSVASIDTSNVNVRKKKRKKVDTINSAESSIDELLPESLSALEAGRFDLSGLSAPTNQLTPSTSQINFSHLSTGCQLTPPVSSGQLTPPVSENGQASPKSVELEKLENDQLTPLHPDVSSCSTLQPSDKSSQDEIQILSESRSETKGPHRYRNNSFSVNGSSNGSFVRERSKYVPLKYRNVDAKISSDDTCHVGKIEVISIDCTSSEDSSDAGSVCSTSILTSDDTNHTTTKLSESAGKKHLNFRDVCDTSATLFETPELLRGADNWKDWRFNSPVESARNLNTPLESSTPVTARLDKLDDLEEESKEESQQQGLRRNSLMYRSVVLRQPNLRVTPARLKYSSKIREISQEKGKKLIILTDTRLKTDSADSDNSDNSEGSELSRSKRSSRIRLPLGGFHKSKTESDLAKVKQKGKQIDLNKVKPADLFSAKLSVPPAHQVQPSVPTSVSKADNRKEADLNKARETPQKKKTLSRSKASVSLSQPLAESPPSTPRRRGKKNYEATIPEDDEQKETDGTNHKVPEYEACSLPEQDNTSQTESIVAKDEAPSFNVGHCAYVKSDNGRAESTLQVTSSKDCASDSIPEDQAQEDKPSRRRIMFTDVNVYYFRRIQGWLCVPKEGGNTLGMEYYHYSEDRRDLSTDEDEEEKEVERSSYDYLVTDDVDSGVKPGNGCYVDATDNLTADKTFETGEYNGWSLEQVGTSSPRGRKFRSSARSDSTPCLLDAGRVNGRSGRNDATTSLLDLRAAANVRKKGECGTRGLYRVSSKSRKVLLKGYGIKELDPMEALETKYLRQSRLECGCSCSGECRPGSCECVDAGIQCQEERSGFPCSCSTSCTNPAGIKRFDPTSVKMHLIQTMLEVQGALDIK